MEAIRRITTIHDNSISFRELSKFNEKQVEVIILPFSPKSKAVSIMKFAGCWSDMQEEDFKEFTTEIAERRKHAFFGRRND